MTSDNTTDAGGAARIHLMRYVAGALPEQQPKPAEPPELHPTAMVKASGMMADADGHMIHWSGKRRVTLTEAA